ncbi:hypothetical protein BJ875DRAFT_527850 [Amylocarpus encephaloides]|uniref:Uncharacterized protein n=1 Tax=Amylocarpus encephaloides TaxID=45428 RepID=A0A9P8C6P4_9HELO|nr:hypothetical protein BJ875DRAFT_527850 [Amylocarpus encephaloides]
MPSWVPTGLGYCYDDVMELTTLERLDPKITSTELQFTMPYLRIADVHNHNTSTTTGSFSGINMHVVHAHTVANVVFTLMTTKFEILPKTFGGCVEPVCAVKSDQVQKLTWGVNKAFTSRSVAEEQRAERMKLQRSARNSCAVFAWFGCKRDIRPGMFRPRLIGMLLSTADDGQTWRRHGLAFITDGDLSNVDVEEKRFQVV